MRAACVLCRPCPDFNMAGWKTYPTPRIARRLSSGARITGQIVVFRSAKERPFAERKATLGLLRRVSHALLIPEVFSSLKVFRRLALASQGIQDFSGVAMQAHGKRAVLDGLSRCVSARSNCPREA